ncbi:MAG: queuosine precursor transporter [Candidatus Paceibacterota bacterium]
MTLLISFSLLIVTLRKGLEYTLALFAGLGVLIAFTITLPLDIFGWPILLGEAFFASFFLGTDIITDNFGEKEAKKMVHSMLAGFVGTILFSKLLIFITPNSEMAIALGSFFNPLTAISIVIVAIVIFFEQRVDIFIFSKIKEVTGERYLWVRNCVSTMMTQTLDVVVAYPIFLFPVFGWDVWKLMVAAIILKWTMALIDTPVVYLSRNLLRNKQSYN